MTQWIVATLIAGLIAGYLAGKEHGSRMVFRMWRESKTRGPNGCVHNVWAVVSFPKGDRRICDDCGESDPQLPKLEN